MNKVITRLMYASVGLAGLMTALIILIAPNDRTVENGVATTLFIILTDAFVLASLMARHEWIKIGTWVTSVYALVMAVIYTWSAKSYYDDNYNLIEGSQTSETLGRLAGGGYIIAIAFVAATLLSLLYPKVRNSEKLIAWAYYATMGLGLLSGFIFGLGVSISSGSEEFEFTLRFGFAVLFLACTSGVIMAIALIVKFMRNATESNKGITMQLQKQAVHSNGLVSNPDRPRSDQPLYTYRPEAPRCIPLNPTQTKDDSNQQP